MTHDQMLDAYPKYVGGVKRDKLAECIDACFGCARTCTACAGACLSEDTEELTKRVRTNPNCADICSVVGEALSRDTGYDANLIRAFLEVCAISCKACGDECSPHADNHELGRICVEACRRCEQACRDLLAAWAELRALPDE